MLFLEEINKQSDLYKYIIKTSQNIEEALEVQYAKKRNLTQILDEIANIKIEAISSDNTQTLLSIIENIKNNLDRINDYIESLAKMLSNSKDIIEKIEKYNEESKKDENLIKDINYFYMFYTEKQTLIEETNVTYEKLLSDVYEYLFKLISNSIVSEKLVNEFASNIEDNEKINEVNEEIIENNEEKDLTDKEDKEDIEINEKLSETDEKGIEDSNAINDENKESEDNIKSQIENDNKTVVNTESINNLENIENETINEDLNEKKVSEDNNILKISEIQNKVFLPYKISDLDEILKKNSKKYKTYQDIINEKYVVSLDKYKNSAFSRFKEAYHLMRERENATFSEALDVAIEVTFKYNLNPAIITACKNLEELDTYMDCLEENKLDNFKFFKVEYEVPPVKI